MPDGSRSSLVHLYINIRRCSGHIYTSTRACREEAREQILMGVNGNKLTKDSMPRPEAKKQPGDLRCHTGETTRRDESGIHLGLKLKCLRKH